MKHSTFKIPHSTFNIPLRGASLRSDYACADGEVAVTQNLKIIDTRIGTIFDLSSGEDSGGDVSDGYPGSSGNAVTPFRLLLPTAPEVEFALKKNFLNGWQVHPDIYPSQLVDRGDTSGQGWGKRAMQLLARFERDVRKQNLFFEPFFVICALRMKDGSRVVPSPPVLMIPNSGAPVVSGTDNFTVENMKMDVVSAVCSLQYRVRIPEELENNEDVIALDLFISDTIPLYNRKGEMTGMHRFDCLNFSHCVDSEGNAGEHRVANERIVQCWQPEVYPESEIIKRVLNTLDFYMISEISMENLASTTGFTDVEFNVGGLELSMGDEPYRPDYAHLSAVAAAGKTEISGRTTIWDLKLVAPLPLPLDQTAPYASDMAYNPRWAFLPDPNAKTYLYAVGDEVRGLPLKRHPNFYGSYYWRGMEGVVVAQAVVAETPSLESRTVTIPGGIWRSDRGVSSLFRDSLLMNLNVGRVIALSRAFRASGLVATTSPTAYAFTTDGVFLLKEMEDGTFRDAGLICSYVLRDAGSYIVNGRSIEFLTVDGEVIEISGTTVRNKSDTAKSVSTTSPGSGIAFGPVDENEKCILVTRPVKLGDAESWKRVVSVKLRGSFDAQRCRLSIYGSPDFRTWTKITSRKGSMITGIWTPLCRYYRVEAEINMKSGESIQGLVFRV